ncbi:MAG: PQQ-binding-like beta-propeller repeat protein [Actinomycetota bacterium]|nr:PQQ-binding-like beta-propeller repeat protein [Actinomycetota bacterium]
MPGQVCGLATAGGPVFVTSCPSGDLSATIVTAVDRDGTVLWHRELPGRPRPPRVSPEGTVWHADDGSLTEVSENGEVLRTVGLARDADEYLGAFVLLPDGFCVLWLPMPPSHVVPHGLLPRVARYKWSGRCRWTTPVSVPGSGSPHSMRVGRTPLLVSGDRVAATAENGSTGSGTTCVLDLATGTPIEVVPADVGIRHVVTGPGEFLFGERMLPLVDRHGRVLGPEFVNRSDSRFRVLGDDREGPHLPGFYTTYPALDRDGTAVFFRDGRLVTVDADLNLREVFALPGDERRVMSRILLLDRGRILFALDSDLFVVDTGLADLDTGPWPCGDGNPRGNPVV